MLSSDKSNMFVSMKVHLASVYEEILSSMKVNSSGSKVNLSSGEVGLSSMKVNLSKILILKSIVCGMCVMFSSDVSWGSMEEIINDDGIPRYNVVLLGDSQVGKTQIVYTKAGHEFKKDSRATIGVDMAYLNVQIKQDNFDQNIKLNVWDTAGLERFKSIILYYVKQAPAVVLVYDITDKKSFDNIQTWTELAKKNAAKNPVYFLVGNKTDMENEGKRNVRTEDAEKFANDNNMRFFEVSAQTGTNIDELFAAIAKACVKKGPIEKIKNEYIENTKNKYPTKNKNPIINVSQESEDNKGNNQTPTPSKNKRCDCCPCCNKDEDDKKEEIISIKPMFNQLNQPIILI